MNKELIESIKKMPYKEQVKHLRSLKLPTKFKEEFNFLTRPGSKLDIGFFLEAPRKTQDDYLAYCMEEPLVMNERLKGRLKASKSLIARLMLRKNLNTEECNYIALDTAGKLTFHPKPWLQQFEDDGTFCKEGRQEISLAKLLRRLGIISAKCEKLLAPHIERCTHAFKNEYMVEETTFKKAYSYPKDGWVSSSCMRGKAVDCFYEELGAVPMLLKQDGEVVGRFLKWNLPDGVYFDRLYFKEEKNFNWLKEYCRDNKIREWSKDAGKMVMPVKEKLDWDSFVPYMDTFKFFSPDKNTFYGKLELAGKAQRAVYYHLENQEGGYATGNKGWRLCAISGEVYPMSELIKKRSGEHKGRHIHRQYETT